MMSELKVLPVEILSIIVNHKDLNGWGGILRLVCKSWNLIVKSQNIYKPNVYLTVTLYKHATKVYFELQWYESVIIKTAAKVGSIEMIEWATTKGLSFYVSASSAAASNGHLECLKYLHENGCPWDTYALTFAAYNGHLECLKYLHENGCPFVPRACSEAASNGHLECLKYLHENGCPWDKWACHWTAQNGHLECLKYLHENGCPWDKQECLRVANVRNNSACYEYIKNT